MSLPATLDLEQDIAHTDSHQFQKDGTHTNAKAKGKERSRQPDPSQSLTPETSSSEALDKIEYPPANEDSEETRRVEEACLTAYNFSSRLTSPLEPPKMGDC